MKRLTLLAAMIVCAGCAVRPTQGVGDLNPKVDMNDQATILAMTTSTRDEFKKLTTYSGPNIRSGYDQVLLRAWKHDAPNNPINYQLYVTDYYNGQWRFYNEAYDEHGARMDTMLLDRQVISCRDGCTHTETVAMNVTRTYLERYQDSGIRVKISGKAGEVTVTMPGPVIKGFLAAVDTK